MDEISVNLAGAVRLVFRRLPRPKPGEFIMGARGMFADEEPAHEVQLSHDYWLGKFVVTEEQFVAVARLSAGLRPLLSSRAALPPNRPAVNVSWDTANLFCETISKHWQQLCSDIRLHHLHCRLPTEAEWEWACLAGQQTDFYNGDGLAALEQVAWVRSNSGNVLHSVDEKPEQHPFGLYGMHGNVWQWTADYYDKWIYRTRVDGAKDPWNSRPSGKELNIVLRGGAITARPAACRAAQRFHSGGQAKDRFGFRLCLSAVPLHP